MDSSMAWVSTTHKRATAVCLTMHQTLMAVLSNILQIKGTGFTSRAPLFVLS
jgi:hypothetical protein